MIWPIGRREFTTALFSHALVILESHDSPAYTSIIDSRLLIGHHLYVIKSLILNYDEHCIAIKRCITLKKKIFQRVYLNMENRIYENIGSYVCEHDACRFTMYTHKTLKPNHWRVKSCIARNARLKTTHHLSNANPAASFSPKSKQDQPKNNPIPRWRRPHLKTG